MDINELTAGFTRRSESLHRGIYFAPFTIDTVNGAWSNVLPGGGYFYAPRLVASPDNPMLLVGKASLYVYADPNVTLFTDGDCDVTVLAEPMPNNPGYLRPVEIAAAGVEGRSGRAYFLRSVGVNAVTDDLDMALGQAAVAGVAPLAGELAAWWASKAV